jgi:hypothetical protein
VGGRQAVPGRIQNPKQFLAVSIPVYRPNTTSLLLLQFQTSSVPFVFAILMEVKEN